MTDKELTHSKLRSYMVKCECGEEIMLLPDVKAMSNAVEIHVAMHMHKLKDPASKPIEADRLRDALIAQILSIAIQPENDEPYKKWKIKAETKRREAKNTVEKPDANKYFLKTKRDDAKPQ